MTKTQTTQMTVRRGEDRSVLYFRTNEDALCWARQLVPGAKLGAAGHVTTGKADLHISLGTVSV